MKLQERGKTQYKKAKAPLKSEGKAVILSIRPRGANFLFF